MRQSEKIKKIVFNPWSHLIFLALLLAFFYFQSPLSAMSGGHYYFLFIEKMASGGGIDFSIPGFHGGDFLALPLYLLTHSEKTAAIFNILAGILNIFLIYLAVKEIFKNEKFGIWAAYFYLLSPLDYSNAWRAEHHTPMIMLIFLGLYLLYKNSKLAFLAFGWSYIIRPFGIILAPIFFYKKKFLQFFLSLIVPAVYLLAQYWQIGRINIGVHPDLAVANLFFPSRLFLNLVYAFQNYFSIHNYSFANCLKPDDMIHLSPFIAFFALIGILNYKKYFFDRKLFFTLLISSTIALILPASFYHLDMWYLWAFNFLLFLLALPVIEKFYKIIPILVFSFSFQFLYVFLTFRPAGADGYYGIFLVPAAILIISLVYTANQFLINKPNNHNA